jgi:hypothetical protein
MATTEPVQTGNPVMAFFDISLDTANALYTWGWRLSLGGAIITAIGVGILFLGTRVRDHDFETQMGALGSTTADTLERAGKLEVVAENLRRDNLSLQRDLERERIERLKLEEKQRPRTITAEQRAVMLACLAGGVRGPVTVVPKTFDNEAEEYAAKIVEVLQTANFELRPNEGPRPFGFGRAGIFGVFHDAATPPAHAGLIQFCLKQIGVELSGGANPDWVKDPNLIIIAVGQKP